MAEMKGINKASAGEAMEELGLSHTISENAAGYSPLENNIAVV